MNKLSNAIKKMNKKEPKKHKLDHHTSDSQKETELKENLAGLADKVKQEGIK